MTATRGNITVLRTSGRRYFLRRALYLIIPLLKIKYNIYNNIYTIQGNAK